MRIETTTQNVYTFNELSDTAKESARDWYRSDPFPDWHEFVIDGAKEVGALLGIEIDNIWFSGFSSQGDGACFTGSYS